MRALLLALVLPAAACGRPASREAPRPSAAARLDSVTAARLCANPEQTRAGLAACELRDQAPEPAPHGYPKP